MHGGVASVVDGRLELEGGYLTMNIAGGLHPVVHLLGRATAQYKGVFADMNNGKSFSPAVFGPHYSFIHLLQTNLCPIPVQESSSTPAGAAAMQASEVTSKRVLERYVSLVCLRVLESGCFDHWLQNFAAMQHNVLQNFAAMQHKGFQANCIRTWRSPGY
jgi:hypothetical protein